MYQYSFEKLDVWQLARKLIKEIYKLTSDFPDEEKFGLVSQLRRAGISIISNIAEGSSRSSAKEQCYYLERSYGSLLEMYSQLYIAIDLSYINQDELTDVSLLIKEISNKLNALKKSLMNKSNKQINK
ncbi:MAG: four helix bundle protein [Prevotellaceae bacterium]|jgi:four helix bundle protein|nr:four helix bundle protein [Prevotellaceae bacterium]